MIKASILKSQEIITILASSKKSISVVFNHFSPNYNFMVIMSHDLNTLHSDTNN